MGLDRVIEEFKDISKNPISNCPINVGLKNENDFREWKVTLSGPKDTSYGGGLFFLSIKFPDNYPEKEPEVCFLTPIYHLNVNPKAPKTSGDGVKSLGHVYLSILNCWKPEYKMREVLANIFALFYMANPDSPYGLDIAEEFRDKRPIYEEKIKYFTKKYNNPFKVYQFFDRNIDWDFNL